MGDLVDSAKERERLEGELEKVMAEITEALTVTVSGSTDLILPRSVDVAEIPAESKVEEIAASLPELPLEKFRRYTGELGISAQNARQIYKYKAVSDFFDECTSLGAGAKNLS